MHSALEKQPSVRFISHSLPLGRLERRKSALLHREHVSVMDIKIKKKYINNDQKVDLYKVATPVCDQPMQGLKNEWNNLADIKKTTTGWSCLCL